MRHQLEAIYGIVCKTQKGKDSLAHLPTIIPTTFPKQRTNWWIDHVAGVAIYSPHLIGATDSHGSFAVRAIGTAFPIHDGTPSLERQASEIWLGSPATLSSLTNDFAAVVWNSERSELLLVRDHLGQRCIFVRETEEAYFFCSEFEPLLDRKLGNCRFDFESGFHYLAYGQPVPGRTLVQDIFRVPAAHYLTWRPGKPMVGNRYWSPLVQDAQKVLDELGRNRIIATLDASIENRLSHGQQALLLSGGLDSSYIAASLSDQIGSERVTAYTVEFPGIESANETLYAKAVADSFGIKHQIVQMTVTDALETLPNVLNAAETM